MGNLHESREVQEAYRTKPDPDEPWRYVCPNCGGQVHANAQARRKPYQCTRCRKTWRKDGLRDKKNGQ